MFWLGSLAVDRSAPSSPIFRYFDRADESLTFLWKEKCRTRSMKMLLKKKRSRARRCLESSITTALSAGILLSLNTVMFTKVSSIPVMEFLTITGCGSWLLCLLIGLILQQIYPEDVSPLFGRVRDTPRLLAMGICFSISSIAFYYALSKVAVIEAVTLFYLHPVLSTIFGAAFMRTICGYQTSAGTFICFLGAMCIAVPLQEIGQGLNMWHVWTSTRQHGMALGIGASVAGAFTYLLSGGKWDSRTAREFSNPIALGLWSFQVQVAAGSLCLVNNWPEAHIPLGNLTKNDWILIGGFIVCGVTSQLLSFWIIRNKTKSFIVVLKSTHIIWAPLGAFLVSMEYPPVFGCAGGIFMLVGISIMSMQAQHRDDDMEDWNLDNDPNSEYVFQTTGTMFAMDVSVWT